MKAPKEKTQLRLYKYEEAKEQKVPVLVYVDGFVERGHLVVERVVGGKPVRTTHRIDLSLVNTSGSLELTGQWSESPELAARRFAHEQNDNATWREKEAQKYAEKAKACRRLGVLALRDAKKSLSRRKG